MHNTAAIVETDLWKTHICTFRFHFALKPRPEHSFSVLMRQRIKQQTEGPLCSPSPPQRAPSLGVERQREGGGWKEHRPEIFFFFLSYVL